MARVGQRWGLRISMATVLAGTGCGDDSGSNDDTAAETGGTGEGEAATGSEEEASDGTEGSGAPTVLPAWLPNAIGGVGILTLGWLLYRNSKHPQ